MKESEYINLSDLQRYRQIMQALGEVSSTPARQSIACLVDVEIRNLERKVVVEEDDE